MFAWVIVLLWERMGEGVLYGLGVRCKGLGK